MPVVIGIVEDDEAMRQAIRRVLSTGGFATESFGSAESFLVSGAAPRVGCLVLDIRLPGMSGVELFRVLRSEGNHVPTVFITAQDERRLAGLGLESNDSVLVKPFAGESLLQAVSRSIST